MFTSCEACSIVDKYMYDSHCLSTIWRSHYDDLIHETRTRAVGCKMCCSLVNEAIVPRLWTVFSAKIITKRCRKQDVTEVGELSTQARKSWLSCWSLNSSACHHLLQAVVNAQTCSPRADIQEELPPLEVASSLRRFYCSKTDSSAPAFVQGDRITDDRKPVDISITSAIANHDGFKKVETRSVG
jgi:hypothetical protein